MNMFFFKKNIKSITVTESNLLFKVKEKNENFDFALQDVKNVYIDFNTNMSFYFFDFISLLIIGIVVAVNFWLSLVGVFFIGLVGIIFRGVYLTLNKKYFITLKLKNGNSFNFHFTNFEKMRVLEQVKLIRGKIIDINFLNTKQEIN